MGEVFVVRGDCSSHSTLRGEIYNLHVTRSLRGESVRGRSMISLFLRGTE